MRKILCFAVLNLGLLLVCFSGFAQQKTISGTVTSSADNKPLSGVTVTVKGTDRISQTNASGFYSILAGPNETLRFSYVGHTATEMLVGDRTTISLQLKSTQQAMEEVIVTAMDIKRNPKELGYSVQKVSGSEVQESQRENFVNSLQGRVAGITITPTSGMAGSSSQLVLRGFNSIALNNSPLFVIDGIIVDNSSIGENDPNIGFGARPNTAPGVENRGNDYTNRIADLNPNDIESITVLKGPEATALYGSQASSGAIVITTKRANTAGRTQVSYDNAFRIQKITRIPEFQRLYMGGTNGVDQDIFSFFGPAFTDTSTIYDNDIKDFFKTGFAQTHNVSAEFGKENYSFRFSGSAFLQDGSIPNNTYKKYNARISNFTKIGKYIDISPSFSYIRSTNEKPLRGAASYLLNFLVWPADNDVTDWTDAEGNKKPLYAANPNGEIDNPYFNVNKNQGFDQTDRMIATMGVNINPFKWLSLSGRFGYDTYKTDGLTRYDSMSSILTRPLKGAQTNYYQRYYGYNHTLTATARHTIGDFTGRIMVGNMWQDYETQMTTVYGTNLSSFNSKDSTVSDPTTRFRNLNMVRNGLPNYSRNRQAAYFGEASIGWKSAVFLTYSHRFEESSIFPKEFRNYNYPAGSLSIMVSDLIPQIKNSNVMNYFKLRGSLASTARSSAPYANQSIFNQNIGSGGGWYYGFTNANPLLSPEKQKTYELGTELRFFNSRLNLDFTYYNTENTNLIVENFRASYGTGFVLNTLNVGSNKNTGIEIAVDATPVSTQDFRWNTRFNFNRMRNEVTGLPANVPEFYISDTWLYGNARGGLKVGGPTTTITGLGYQRNNKGEILISPTTGLPLVMPASAPFIILGDRNPDFTLGWFNTLSYKNLRFTMLWDLKVGGDIYNATEMFMTRSGRSLRTTDRTTPRIVTGVLQDGLENTETPTVNTIAITPYTNQNYFTTMPEEAFVEKDVNWLRLRDITLSYTFPASAIRNLGFLKSLSAFVTGNDLILITNYTGADPAVSGVSAGSRGVGAFGFDYGTVGTPISVNLGLRANF
ncbi:MAG TPA: SusC/RagA family TonB-linked outer membrane protein [Flavisolibacter sp.]|nr:SusC/RagA family TonB-linked outer membrane protein [Flavisolibacter sp.]